MDFHWNSKIPSSNSWFMINFVMDLYFLKGNCSSSLKINYSFPNNFWGYQLPMFQICVDPSNFVTCLPPILQHLVGRALTADWSGHSFIIVGHENFLVLFCTENSIYQPARSECSSYGVFCFSSEYNAYKSLESRNNKGEPSDFIDMFTRKILNLNQN